MRVWRVELLLVPVFSLMLSSFIGNVVFAEDEITITVSDDSVEMNLMQGQFGEGAQTITASTTSIAGYTVRMRTTGASSAWVNTTDSSYTIPTFDLESGEDSIPVADIGDGYGYSVDGGAHYLPVPEPTAVKATALFKTTAAGQGTHELTFGVKVPMGTKAGIYENTFVIEAVANLEPCAIESICYYGNDDDGTGEMDDQDSVVSGSNVMLLPSNFSRPGYGFAGWNTEIDGTGTNYGPSQTITVGDLSEEGLQLYARWVQSAGDLQEWAGCDAMNVGDVTALTDTRDGSTYAIAKYADNKCWMMENLRLDLSDVNVIISDQNTNKPSSDFVTAVNTHPGSSNSFCTGTGAACIDTILHNTNNINRDLTASYSANDSSSSWYSYGVYYNYYTATAGTGGYDLKTRGAQVSGDICPAGWRLPTMYTHKDDTGTLDKAYGGDGTKKESGALGLAGSERWRAYPLNYIFSGEQNGASGYNRGISTGMNGANNSGAANSYNFWLRATAVNMTSNTTSKTRGQTVRCVTKRMSNVIGNIHYNANGGTGTMVDDEDINFADAVAQNNGFTRTNYMFTGWNTSADGRGVVVLEGGAVDTAARQLELMEGDTLTLYATWQPVYRVVYAGNGADDGSMASQTHEHVTGNFHLVASDYEKAGYGFAGWSADVNAGTKLLNHQDVVVYGPNQSVSLDATFTGNADANNQITLYAVWLPADTIDTMQSFSSSRCAAMNTGEYLALRDERDGNVYAISKLVDGHCWMTENLRLNPSTTTFTSVSTNGPTTAFIGKAAVAQDSTILCNDSTSGDCIDRVLFNGNNINRGLTASPDTDDNASSWYSYGMMYGWYTATAGNGDYEMASGNVVGDICPAGWRLPTGGVGGEFQNLANVVGGATVTAINNNLLKFPNNFIYSGDYNYNMSGGRGTYGRYWSATASSNEKAYRLGVASSYQGATPTGEWDKWDAFAVRCVVK